MKNEKILAVAAIPAIIAIILFVFTQAFHMLTAPSDISVIGGVLLLCVSFFVVVKLSIFAFKKLF